LTALFGSNHTGSDFDVVSNKPAGRASRPATDRLFISNIRFAGSDPAICDEKSASIRANDQLFIANSRFPGCEPAI
jgi:hypothetical protein